MGEDKCYATVCSQPQGFNQGKISWAERAFLVEQNSCESRRARAAMVALFSAANSLVRALARKYFLLLLLLFTCSGASRSRCDAVTKKYFGAEDPVLFFSTKEQILGTKGHGPVP